MLHAAGKADSSLRKGRDSGPSRGEAAARAVSKRPQKAQNGVQSQKKRGKTLFKF